MPDLDPTYGALFVGVLLSAVLFGVTMLQTFIYFQQYPSDRPWCKLAVCWLWFLDALHLALSAHFVYYYLVENYNNPDALLSIVWSFKFRIVVDAFVVCSVHTLYTSRLWTLLAIDYRVEPFGKEVRRWSRQKMTVRTIAFRWVMRRIAPWVISVLVVIGYAITIVMCYEAFKLNSFTELTHAPWATYVPLGSSTVTDGAIAGSLCYFLARCRPQSEAKNGPIKTLMMYTLNTGIMTSVCSLIAIVMMATYPSTFIPIAIEFIVIKLYINSFMAMLNARTVLHPTTGSGRRAPFLPAYSRSFRDPAKQKHLPFPSFPVSASSLQLTQLAPAPVPSPTHSTNHGVHGATSEGGLSADWGRASPNPPLPAPCLSHPDVCIHYGAIETAVGVAFPAGSLSQRFHSFATASSSGSPSASAHPLVAAYASPVDPLTPAPLLLPPAAEMQAAEVAAPPDYSSPSDGALSPLRFASYSSVSQDPSGEMMTAPSTPMPPRPSRPRLPSAYSTDTDAEEPATLPPLLYSDRASFASGTRSSYVRTVSAARESRRESRREQPGRPFGSEVADERGVWVWGGPGEPCGS